MATYSDASSNEVGVPVGRLLTNHPRKIVALEGFGITVVDQIPVTGTIGPLFGRPKIDGQPGYVRLTNTNGGMRPGLAADRDRERETEHQSDEPGIRDGAFAIWRYREGWQRRFVNRLHAAVVDRLGERLGRRRAELQTVVAKHHQSAADGGGKRDEADLDGVGHG